MAGVGKNKHRLDIEPPTRGSVDSGLNYQTRHVPDSNDYGEPKAAQHRRGTLAALNESWPLRDKAGEHARGIEDQPEPIDVEVRIEWADGGEEWLPGRAHRWTASHVFVRFQDARSPTGFVWVRARDVRRL